MSTRDKKSKEKQAKFKQRSDFWHDLFKWFVHDLDNSLDSCHIRAYMLEHDVTKELQGIDLKRYKECLESIRASIEHLYIFSSVAETIAFHEDRYYYMKRREKCSMGSLLRMIWFHRVSEFIFGREVKINIEEDLRAAQIVNVRADIAKDMFSYLFLFSSAISEDNKPVNVSIGEDPKSINLKVHIKPLGLIEEDIKKIWKHPHEFFQDDSPYNIFERHFSRDFSICLAIPAALVLAPFVPCSIDPIIVNESLLKINVTFS